MYVCCELLVDITTNRHRTFPHSLHWPSWRHVANLGAGVGGLCEESQLPFWQFIWLIKRANVQTNLHSVSCIIPYMDCMYQNVPRPGAVSWCPDVWPGSDSTHGVSRPAVTSPTQGELIRGATRGRTSYIGSYEAACKGRNNIYHPTFHFYLELEMQTVWSLCSKFLGLSCLRSRRNDNWPFSQITGNSKLSIISFHGTESYFLSTSFRSIYQACRARWAKVGEKINPELGERHSPSPPSLFHWTVEFPNFHIDTFRKQLLQSLWRMPPSMASTM